MTTINVARYADGRTIYNCKNPTYPPTNPRLGLGGNTVYWNSQTHEATVVVPRQQDEYFSLASAQLTSRNFQAIPRTKEKAPFISTNSTGSQSKDLYDRVAPPTLERGRLQTTVSRYSTATNVVPCIPAPERGQPSNIPNKTASSIQYPNQYQPTYTVPIR